MTAVSASTRALVLERDNSACVSCGSSIHGPRGYSIQHRIPRGMGGSKHDPRINLPSNLIVLCGSATTGCHGWAESHRNDARDQGYLLYRLSEPSKVAVYTYTGWTLYDDEGGVSYPTPPKLPADDLAELARECERARLTRMGQAA
jgi:hypothetical protein